MHQISDRDTTCGVAAARGREMNELLTNADYEDFAEAFIDQLTPNNLAKLLSIIPLTESEDDDRPNRFLALRCADVLGPETAQDLYHFSVLVTKLT